MPMLRFQKVFVTNPTSIIGGHTINALVRSGYHVQYLPRHPFASQQQHFERRNPDTCYHPFLIPITAQPGDPIYETTCEKALDGVNAIVYTGPNTVQELVDWPTLKTGVCRLLASARKADSPLQSLVLHTHARGIDPLFLPRADPSAACPTPEHLPVQDFLQIWSQLDPSRASEDSSNRLPHFRVTNIASVPPLSLRPRLGDGVFTSPAFRDLVTPLQELDWHPPSLFTHHWVDPCDLADIIARAVTRDLVRFSHTPIALHFHKTVRPPPPKFLLTQHLVSPPPISESSREAIRKLMLERHPEHPDAVTAAADSPAPIITQIRETEQKTTRLLISRDWTPPEETIRDLLRHLGPDIPAMTTNTIKLQDQATAFFQAREMERQRSQTEVRFVRTSKPRIRFFRSKSAESNANPQGSRKAKAKASPKSKVKGTSFVSLLADAKAKDPEKQPKRTVEAPSTPTPSSTSSPASSSLNEGIENWRTSLAEFTPRTPTKSAAPAHKTRQKSKTKRSQSCISTTKASSSSLKNSIEDWRAFFAEFTPSTPPQTLGKSKINSHRVSTAEASSPSSGDIKRLGRSSRRKEVKKPRAGAVWDLVH